MTDYLFPADRPSKRWLENLRPESNSDEHEPPSLRSVLRAAVARGWRLNICAYSVQWRALMGLEIPHAQGRLLLRYPGGFGPTAWRQLKDWEWPVQVRVLEHPQIVHTKLYWLENGGHDTSAGRNDFVILGSSNATAPGFGGNIEANYISSAPAKPTKHDPRALFEELWSASVDFDPERHQPTVSLADDAPPLFPYQREALEALDKALADHLEKPASSGPQVPGAMVSLPTGAGKTVVAVRWCLERVFARGPGTARVLWIADTHQLLEQAQAAFDRHGTTDPRHRLRSLNLKDIGKGNIWDLARMHDVVFGTRRLLASRLTSDSAGAEFDAVVIDEGHHVSGANRDYPSILGKVQHRTRVGISATPFRENAAADPELYKYFDPKPDERDAPAPVYVKTFDQLRNVEWLGQPIFAEVEHEKCETHARLRATSARDSSFRSEELADPRRVRSIAAHFRRERHRPALFFARDVKDANALTNALLARGVRAQAIHSGDDVVGHLTDTKLTFEERSELSALLNDPEQDQLDAIVSVDMYIEGLDIPRLQSVFLARPTFSARVYLQMRGRGLRGPAVGGTPTCTVVDCVDEIVGVNRQVMDSRAAESYERVRSGVGALLLSTRSLNWAQVSDAVDADGDEVDDLDGGSFLEAPEDVRAFQLWDALLGDPPMMRSQTVRAVGSYLRKIERLGVRRFHRTGPVADAIARALDRAVEFGLVERHGRRYQAVVTSLDLMDDQDFDYLLLKATQSADDGNRALDPTELVKLATDCCVERWGFRLGRKCRKSAVREAISRALERQLRTGELVVLLDGTVAACRDER